MKAQRVLATGEHDHEPVHGLPGELPPGEQVLWRGAPDWRLLAVQGFHLRKLALYFALLLAWRGIAVVADGGTAWQAVVALAWPLPLALVALALVAGTAWLSARTTVYTLTNQRVVMRLGIVLSITFNLPLRRLESAALRQAADGSGDICLLLMAPQRIAYLHLWPHARPWQVKRTQPMLRALREVQAPAQLLVDAMRAAQGATPTPTPTPTPARAEAAAHQAPIRPAQRPQSAPQQMPAAA